MGDAYVLEVQAFPGLSLTNKANPMIARISRELDIPMVAILIAITIDADREGDAASRALDSRRR